MLLLESVAVRVQHYIRCLNKLSSVIIQTVLFILMWLVSPDRYFLWKLVTVVLTQSAWQDAFTWPLVILLLSCSMYPLASSCAHTFSSMSERARHICFFFDYGALSFYSLGKCVGSTVRRFTNNTQHRFPVLFIMAVAAGGVVQTLASHWQLSPFVCE